MWLEVITAVSQLQTCMVAVARLDIGVLVDYVNWRLLYHTRRIPSVATQCRFSTWASFCLLQHWHKHQAQDDASYNWFHFYVYRDFHCWQFYVRFFYGWNKSILYWLSSLSNFLCLLSHLNTSVYLPQSRSPCLQLTVSILFNFQPISRWLLWMSVPLLLVSIKQRFEVPEGREEFREEKFVKRHWSEEIRNLKIKFPIPSQFQISSTRY